jgi:hypothetical protein
MLQLDKAPHLLDRLRRAIAVVQTDEIDLASIDSALIVDHLEIGCFGATNSAEGGSRPAVGYGLADLDFGVGDAGRVLGAGGPVALGGIGDCGRSRL